MRSRVGDREHDGNQGQSRDGCDHHRQTACLLPRSAALPHRSPHAPKRGRGSVQSGPVAFGIEFNPSWSIRFQARHPRTSDPRDPTGPAPRSTFAVSERTAEVVICGAGIAGVAAAYHLAVRRGVRDVVLVDERPPLSLTSDKSTECYRNWWPGPGDAMVAVMNRSIDLLEELARESGNVFRMNRRGYLFATADPERVREFAGRRRRGRARRRVRPPARARGSDYRPAPPEGFEGQPTGTDVITDRSLIRRHFPLSPRTRWRCCTPGAAAGSAASSSGCTCSSARATRGPSDRGPRGGRRHAGRTGRGVTVAGPAAPRRSRRRGSSTPPGRC